MSCYGCIGVLLGGLVVVSLNVGTLCVVLSCSSIGRAGCLVLVHVVLCLFCV